MTKRDISDQGLREIALDQAMKMRLEAGWAKQMGMHAMAAWLRNNADAAMKWAARRQAIQDFSASTEDHVRDATKEMTKDGKDRSTAKTRRTREA